MQNEGLELVHHIRGQIQAFQMTDEDTSLLFKIQLSIIGDNLIEFINLILTKLKVSVIQRNNEQCLCSWFFQYEIRFYLDLHFRVVETNFEIISIIHYEENENDSDNDTASENEDYHVNPIRNHYDYDDYEDYDDGFY